MSSIKVKFRPSSFPDQKGRIYYQLISERKVRQINTEFRIFAHEWDAKHSTVVVSDKSERHRFTLSVHERIHRDVQRLIRIERKLRLKKLNYSVDDIVEEFNIYSQKFSLFNFMEDIITKLKRNGRIRTAETYRVTLNSFRKFRKNEDIMMDTIDCDTIEAYEGELHSRGLVPNSISFYLRILRAVYNRAVDIDITDDRNPFRHVYTGVDKTMKRALPIQEIKKIKSMNINNSSLNYARDMFILSFFLRGMSFIDMAFLRKTDLKDGHITYRRRKTGQQLQIEWTKEMQTILNKYPENKSDYLFPIIRNTGMNELCCYRNESYRVNSSLKTIAKLAGLKVPLTFYVARHSWASAAKSKGIPISVISEGMGHESESTTRIYLASLETSVVDRANSIIIRSLR